jgi:TBC1 domain family protein 5
VFQKEQSDDTASISSAKSLRDAERQLAEVRLAMLSMGKAMTEWMSVLREGKDGPDAAEAWAGLDRVRDTLLEAAGQEVDDLVKDWAWNDALDASRSRSSSTQPTPVEAAPASPLPPPLPSLSPPRAEEAQITPKAQTSARMPDNSSLPTPPGRMGPQLHLSTRHDQPAPGLSRTLHHPRPSLGSNPARRLWSNLTLDASKTQPLGHAARLASPPTDPSSPSPPQDMDPLAGLGVETIPLDHARESRRRSAIFRGSPGSGTGSAATSPRMAVGSDPLGVHL